MVFEKIKTKKDFRYVVFFIKDEKFIDVEATGNWFISVYCASGLLNFTLIVGNRDSTYEEFLEHLKIVAPNGEKDCRYGLFDFEYTHQCQGTQEVR